MDAVNSVIAQLESSVTEDLNLLLEFPNQEQTCDLVDNIKLNLSAQIASLRVLIYDKVRIRQLEIKTSNQITMVNGNEVVVLLHGVAIRPNTPQATGKFVVIWNKEHSLNLLRDNFLSVKTKESSTLLALLALCNQLVQLKLIKARIFTSSSSAAQHLKNTTENLAIFHANGYTDEQRAPIRYEQIIRLIYKIVTENKLVISYSEPNPPLADLHSTMLDTARGMIE